MTSQFCRWNAVRRFFGTGRGYGFATIAPIVVVFGASATDLRAGSLNVFSRQSSPPQCVGVGPLGTRANAATAPIEAASTTTPMSPALFTTWAFEIVRLRARAVYSGFRAGVAELANALGLGPSGTEVPYRFKSCRPH
jgi:hypothetical protein